MAVTEKYRRELFTLELKAILSPKEFEAKEHLIPSVDKNHYWLFRDLLLLGWDFNKTYQNIEKIFYLTSRTTVTAQDVVQVLNAFEAVDVKEAGESFGKTLNTLNS